MTKYALLIGALICWLDPNTPASAQAEEGSGPIKGQVGIEEKAPAPDPIPTEEVEDDGMQGSSLGSQQNDHFKDPTQATDDLEGILDTQGRRAVTAAPEGPGLSIPHIELRGRVVAEDQSAIGIISVDGNLYMIKDDTRLSATTNSGVVELEVVRLDTQEVHLKILNLNQLLILR